MFGYQFGTGGTGPVAADDDAMDEDAPQHRVKDKVSRRHC